MEMEMEMEMKRDVRVRGAYQLELQLQLQLRRSGQHNWTETDDTNNTREGRWDEMRWDAMRGAIEKNWGFGGFWRRREREKHCMYRKEGGGWAGLSHILKGSVWGLPPFTRRATFSAACSSHASRAHLCYALCALHITSYASHLPPIHAHPHPSITNQIKI